MVTKSQTGLHDSAHMHSETTRKYSILSEKQSAPHPRNEACGKDLYKSFPPLQPYESMTIPGAISQTFPDAPPLSLYTPSCPVFFQVPSSSLELCLPCSFSILQWKRKDITGAKRPSHCSYPRPLLECQELKARGDNATTHHWWLSLFRPLTDRSWQPYLSSQAPLQLSWAAHHTCFHASWKELQKTLETCHLTLENPWAPNQPGTVHAANSISEDPAHLPRTLTWCFLQNIWFGSRESNSWDLGGGKAIIWREKPGWGPQTLELKSR